METIHEVEPLLTVFRGEEVYKQDSIDWLTVGIGAVLLGGLLG